MGKALRGFMRELQLRFGSEGEKATYEVVAERLGVSTSLVGTMMKGIAAKYETICQMSEKAGIPRTVFLKASGIIPERDDIEYDRGRHPELTQEIDKQTGYTLDARESSLLHAFKGSASMVLNDLSVSGIYSGGTGERVDMAPVDLAEDAGIEWMVKIHGDSMPPFGDGDYVSGHFGEPVVGDRVAVTVAGESFVKKLERIEERDGETVFILSSSNGAYKEIIARSSETTFQGVVTHHMHRAR